MNRIVRAAEDLYAAERYDLRELHGFTRKVGKGENRVCYTRGNTQGRPKSVSEPRNNQTVQPTFHGAFQGQG